MIRQTELLQKRAIRTIHNAFYNSHTDPTFRKSKLLKLHDIFEYQSLLFTYDYLNNKLPGSFDGKFPKNRDVLNNKDTRQSDNLFVPNFSSKYAQKLPAYHLPKLWNKWIRLLPDSNKRYSIKNSIKSHKYYKLIRNMSNVIMLNVLKFYVAYIYMFFFTLRYDEFILSFKCSLFKVRYSMFAAPFAIRRSPFASPFAIRCAVRRAVSYSFSLFLIRCHHDGT